MFYKVKDLKDNVSGNDSKRQAEIQEKVHRMSFRKKVVMFCKNPFHVKDSSPYEN